MRRTIVAVGALLLLGCADTTVPVTSPGAATPSAATAASPLATPESTRASSPEAGPALRPLPAVVAARPAPDDPSATLGATTDRVGLATGFAYPYRLGHCGLGSPFDLDGSLWDPMAGHDGREGPLTEAHIGELINPTSGTVTLLTRDVAEFRTPLGAVITLARLPGERAYLLCS
jgi:hypothetical protein